MDPVIEYYNKIAAHYDDDRFNNSYGRFIDTQEKKILDQLLPDQDLTILDLACGSGRLLKYAKIGLDASSEMLELAKQKFPEKVLIQAEADKMPLASNSIDIVFSFHFFMHFDRAAIDNILKEAHRVLNTNGRMIFDIPSEKRRKLKGYTGHSWHGNYSAHVHEIVEMTQTLFTLNRTFGLLFLPIHRIPKPIRKYCVWLDYFMANSFLKVYSSYLIIELRKK